MGAIDLVIQIEALRRWRPAAAHRAGRAPGGRGIDRQIFPKYRGDLLEAAVVVRRMLDGAIEETCIPRNPLDVLAQQLVAWHGARWPVDELHALVTRAHNFRDLSRDSWRACWTCSPAATRPTSSPSPPARRLGPHRRHHHQPQRRPGGRRRIRRHHPRPRPVRRLPGRRGGRQGTARRRAGRGDGLRVARRRGVPARRQLVADRGDQAGPAWCLARSRGAGQDAFLEGRRHRPAHRAGACNRRVPARGRADEPDAAGARLREDHALDELAARNLVAYLGEQRETTGALPTDRQLVVERFRDELGDWRLCLLSLFGGRVHAPWAMAIEARMAEQGRPAQDDLDR